MALLGGLGWHGGEATDFGGMVLGRERDFVALLQTLGADGSMPWVRGQSAAIQAHGLRGVGDVRYLFSREPGDPTDRLPTDLRMVRDIVHEGVLRSPHIHTWEVWNEPDFHFVSDSAADMAAVLKAAWWGVKSARAGDRVLMPSMAFRPGRYAVELMRNGAASFTEAYNLHFYGWASDYAKVLAHHRVLAHAAGLDGPEWVTEVGYLRLPASAGKDPEALARQAAFHERMMVESSFERVGVHLAFAFSPAREASWDLGLTESDGRWRPALRSMLQLAARLRAAKPEFRLVHRRTGECLGVALRESDGEAGSHWWMALWSPARGRDSTLPGVDVAPEWPERFPVTVNWSKGTAEVRIGLEGETALAPEQVAALELSPSRVQHLRVRDVALPRVTGCDWRRGDHDGGVQVRRFWRRELSALPPPTPPSPVVLQWIIGAGARSEKPSQTVNIAGDVDGGVRLRATNLGNEEVHGHWRVEAPSGWQISTGSHEGTTAGAWTLPASATIEVPVHVRARRGAGGHATEPARLSAAWRDCCGRQDQASIRLRAPPPDGETEGKQMRTISWREWRPRPGHPGAWQVLQAAPGTCHLEVREPAGSQSDAVVCWEVPRGMTVQDGWGADVRRVATGGRVFSQLSLVTRDGEVWRYGELRELPASEPWRVRAALGDFAPTVWSRHLHFGQPDPRRVRWVLMRFQGVHEGDVLELDNVHWFRELARTSAATRAIR
ncbi:MAG: hypothetical protein IT580_13560 [Verrucomicrobiales bacterium]|nr:hypothetical protein [Verrucomicrobiales bacterium]